MRLLRQRLNPRLLPLVMLDVAAVYAGYAGALLLRFDGSVPADSWDELWLVAPAIAAAYVAANLVVGVYHAAWQYGAVRDLFYLGVAVGAVTVGVFVINVFDFAFTREHLPLSVNLIGGSLIYLAMAATKLWPHIAAVQFGSGARNGGKRVLIVGAGESGQLVAREFMHNPHWQYHPVCFVDDDSRKDGIRIHGVPVAGNRHAIPALVARHRIDEVALAMSQMSRESFNELLDICKKAGVSVNIIPSPADVLSGKVDRGVTVSFDRPAAERVRRAR